MRQSFTVDAHPKQVWAGLRDVGAVHERLIPGYVTATRIDGSHRYLTMADGWVVHELVVTVDDDARRLAYAVVEGSRPELEHHHASFQVFDDGPGTSLVVWTTDVLPDELAPEVRLRVERGSQVMARALARKS
ncbi:SRPBCC family protein [Umezawaea endophytica]|uniref:SRPBCC family protein n=1 Tax=Umezawaea endophytica TaxID=1654476 RepID=A0A9X2VJ55_9PSEU|nr:SRPBCC family protein [Umezawaea endophytica]